MTNIDRIQLRKRLLDCGYIEEFGLEHTIDNLLNLARLDDKRAYHMLEEWMQTGRIAKFEPVEGIDRRFLRDTLKMKDPAVILAYGMLLFDPKGNAVVLRREAARRLKFQPSVK